MMQLSYSSANLLLNCEQKFWHHKINNTPKDADSIQDKPSLELGKCFHELLELTLHTYVEGYYYEAHFAKYPSLTESQKLLILAMYKKYTDTHARSNLKVVECEPKIESDTFVGYIDAIMADLAGNWWIVDIKTFARVSDSTIARLKNDFQLNLYALNADKLPYDQRKFAGVRYRVVTKPYVGAKANIDTLLDKVEVWDIPVLKQDLNPEFFSKQFGSLCSKVQKLEAGEAPTRNYSYCESYFTPCEFWSNCHGATVTEGCKSLCTNSKDKTILEDL